MVLRWKFAFSSFKPEESENMLLTFCVSKIHRAKVTSADLDYDSTPPENSITIDSLLMDAAGLLAGQEVTINSLANGTHWKTYVIRGEVGKGEICLNGPPAHHFHKGDLVIILAYGQFDATYAKDSKPAVVFVDDKNAIVKVTKGTGVNLR